MESSNDFIEKLTQFEHGNVPLDSRDKAWYDGFVQGVVATGELQLKNELEGFYTEHQQGKSTRVVQLWAAVGIAAMLAIGGFYLTTIRSGSDPIQLQTNDAPIYSDSASYDTAENKSEKKIENDVDK